MDSNNTASSTYIKKILGISLMDRQRYAAYAAYNGEQLVIQRMVTITGPFSEWKDNIIAEVKKRKAQDWIVIVEELTNHIAQHATHQFSFEDKDPWDNRINYYEGLDWYFALHNIGNLILPKDAERFLIQQQYVEKFQDDQGRTKYNIDWERFNGGHRAILLCVIGAVTEPLSDRFIDEMYGKRLEEEDVYNWRRVFRAITVEYDAAIAKKWNEIDLNRK